MGISHARYVASIAAVVLTGVVALAPEVSAEDPASAPSAPAAASKLPIPAEAAQQTALETIKQVFAADYADAKQADAKLTLAGRLISQAKSTADDPVAKYVLLREARDLAADAGDCDLIDEALATLDAAYAIDLPAMQLEAYQKTVSKTRLPAVSKTIAERLLKLVDESLAAGRLDAADQLAKMAVVAAGKGRDQPLIKQARERSDDVGFARAEHEGAEKAQAALEKNPDDPDANLALGKYQCFVEGAWAVGLPHLAKGSDAGLKELATKSLAAPENPAGLAALGDGWWDASESAKGKDKQALERAARYWYAKALPGLSGLDKIKVGKRLKSAPPTGHPKGAVAAGGHFYKVFQENLSWQDAKAKCEELGGHLVCIGTPREDAMVIQIIESQIGAGQLGKDANKYLLGAYLEDGKWKWITGEKFGYSPNKLPTDAGRPYLRHAGKNWLNTGSASGLVVGYVCEWDK